MANTTETLLLGDLETLKLSEIQWQARGGGAADAADSDSPAEKFIFDSPSAALVYYASELSIVEYGRNEVKVFNGSDVLHCMYDCLEEGSVGGGRVGVLEGFS